MSESALAQGKTFVWHEVYAASSQASVDFYTKALDWGVEEFPMEGMGVYKMLVANGQAVAGVMGTKEMPGMEDVPPHWSVYVGVDDFEGRLAKCKELGATVVVEPMDVPSVGRMALLRDPQGATFWLFKGSS